MSLYVPQTCPRCQREFECKPANIGQCHCYDIKLDRAILREINAKYDACLCNSCLKEMEKKYSQK